MAEANITTLQGDEDDDDEDYIPPENDSQEEEDIPESMGLDENEVGLSRISAKRQRAVDDAFDKMFVATDGNLDFSEWKPQARKRVKINYHEALKQHQFRILADLFGPTAAAKLIRTAKAVAAQYSSKAPAKFEVSRFETSQPATVNEPKFKVFAGQRIPVEQDPNQKSVVKDATSALVPQIPKTQGGLDTLLENLAGPAKISTIVKTSSDWEVFKQKQGSDMKESLETKAQGSQAYLQRKDFLDRVDQRRFEHEKARRDLDRAARGK